MKRFDVFTVEDLFMNSRKSNINTMRKITVPANLSPVNNFPITEKRYVKCYGVASDPT